MSVPVNIILQSADSEFDTDVFNANLRKLAAAINHLAGATVISFNSLPTDETSGFVPATGGTMSGALLAPQVLIGNSSSSSPALTSESVATISVRGVVKQGVHVATPSETVTAEVALTSLIASLRAAGVIADAS